MIRQPVSTGTRWILSAIAIGAMFMAYEAISFRQTQKNPKQTVVPGVTSITTGWQKLTTPNKRGETWLVEDVKATYGRLFLGLGLGIGLSIVVGVAMGAYPWIEALLVPPIAFFAKIPPTAMLAVYFVLFGTKLEMFVAMVGFSVFFTLAQSIYQAAKKDVSDDGVHKAYSLGASSGEVIYEVLWKQILPRVIESIRLQIGPAMVFLIAAEYVVGDVGIGYRIRIQSRILNMDVVYIYLILLGASGLAMEWALTRFRRWLCPWFGE